MIKVIKNSFFYENFFHSTFAFELMLNNFFESILASVF
jgi:hypothetical protein